MLEGLNREGVDTLAGSRHDWVIVKEEVPGSSGGPGGEAALVVGLNAVIVAVTDEEPRVLTVGFAPDVPIEGGAGAGSAELGGQLALPTGPLDPVADRTLELAVRRWVRAQTGIELGYVEQLYTFGDRFRDPRELHGGPRVVSLAYLALVREHSPSDPRSAQWRGAYEFFPWEDWRDGPPKVIDRFIAPALGRWVEAGVDPSERAARRERAGIMFGLEGAPWNGERVLERYELLYEVGLVPETARDRRALGQPLPEGAPKPTPARSMAFDHRRILATAVERLRGKIRYRPVVFELLPPSFTLLQLQRAVEALAGVRLHKQNFRRLVEQGGLVEGTGRLEGRTGGRPAELFRFRREALRERPTPGVGIPGVRRGGGVG